MKDRVSMTPGRMKITPEDGSSEFYATLEMADNPQEEGTPLNKANLLSDETAQKLGLDTDDDPSVSDALAGINLSGTGTLPVSGWKSDTSTSGYYYVDVAANGVTADDRPKVGIVKSFTSSSTDAAMQAAWNTLTGAVAFDGYIRFYAEWVYGTAVTFQWEVTR